MKEPQPEEQASFSCTLSTVLIFDLDTFHILAADVQDTVYVRVKEGGCIVMGNGFHLALIQHQGGFDQGLAVTGGAGMDDMVHLPASMRIDLLDGTDCSLQRAAVVAAVEGIEQGAVFADQSNFCCGGTGIDAKDSSLPL